MDSSAECNALDLSVKTIGDSDRSNSPYEKFSKEPPPAHQAESQSQYESSSLINTPPHESDLLPKPQTMYNIPNQFCPNLDMDIYPRIISEKALHHETRMPLLPPPFMQHYPSLPTDQMPPANIGLPYGFPMPPMTLPTPEVSKPQPPKAPKKPVTATRPFKVYPNVPAFGNDNVDHIMKELDQERYEEYRDKVLKTVELNNNKGTNVKMRRENKNSVPTSTMQDKDEAYLEKRKKNNAAAKRSRDARKRKEDEIAIRAAYLENKVTMLTNLLKKVQNENTNLRHYRDIVHRLNLANIPSFS